MDGEVKLEEEEAKAEAPPPGEMDRREECTAPLYLLDDDASADGWSEEERQVRSRHLAKWANLA